MPTTEKKHIRIWDHDSYSRNVRNQSDLDDLVDQVNLMLGQGWRLTGMEKITSGQEIVISFEREIPEPQTAEQVAKQDKLSFLDLDEADDPFSGISPA